MSNRFHAAVPFPYPSPLAPVMLKMVLSIAGVSEYFAAKQGAPIMNSRCNYMTVTYVSGVRHSQEHFQAEHLEMCILNFELFF